MAHEDNPWSREALENQSRKSRRSDVTNMTWKPGEHNVRILPSKTGEGLPFVKYIVHWVPVKNGKNDRPIIHAVDYKCPVCEFVGSLWSEVYRLKEEDEMTDKSPEVQKLVKQAGKLKGKKTYDMNILHRNDYKTEDGKIKIKRLVAGPTIWKSVMELGNSEKWGNPSTAGKRGYDLTVTVDGDGLKREYTILPDPDRKALTEEEIEALKERGYDLAALRVFSTVKEIFETIMNAKAPLDSIDLKKVKRALEAWSGESLSAVSTQKPASTSDADDQTEGSDDESETDTPVTQRSSAKQPADEEDRDVKTPPADDDDDDEKAEASAAAKKEASKEDKAFSKAEKDEPASDKEDDESAYKLSEMDCRGTHDPDDVGCQECPHADSCKELKKEFRSKAEELGISLKDMSSGVEVEAAIKAKEKELAAKKAERPSGKMGKAGKTEPATAAPAESTGKRKLPF
jgi:hypothetical protein